LPFSVPAKEPGRGHPIVFPLTYQFSLIYYPA
jgi:hypothetical protein